MITHYDTKFVEKDGKTINYPISGFPTKGFISIPFTETGVKYDNDWPAYAGFKIKIVNQVPIYYKDDIYIWHTMNFGAYVIDEPRINDVLMDILINELDDEAVNNLIIEFTEREKLIVKNILD
ncbi:MAG TPA: hypothetical protein VMT63_04755 [Bacteroidales bacterium]|nr:hypothetical protein [Bacteroidales bacterium]